MAPAPWVGRLRFILLPNGSPHFLIGIPIDQLFRPEHLVEVVQPDPSGQSLPAWFFHGQGLLLRSVCLFLGKVIPDMAVSGMPLPPCPAAPSWRSRDKGNSSHRMVLGICRRPALSSGAAFPHRHGSGGEIFRQADMRTQK